MPPPQKSKVDYFPHYCNHGKTIYVLEQRYGNDGYAFWFKLLEILGTTQGHYIDCNDKSMWHYILARGIIDDIKATEILNVLAEMETIDPDLWKGKIIWSKNFVDNLENVYARRNTKPPPKELLLTLIPVNGNSDNINPDASNINPQSKVKEVKEVNNIRASELHENVLPKKSKLKKPANGYSSDFETFWSEIIHRPLDRKADAYKHWKQKTNIPPIDDLIGIVRRYNDSKNGTDPEHILATYNWIKNELYLQDNIKPQEDSIQRWLKTHSPSL